MAAEEEMVTKLAIFLARRNVTSARLEKIVLLLALKYLPINRGEVCLRRREADSGTVGARAGKVLTSGGSRFSISFEFNCIETFEK